MRSKFPQPGKAGKAQVSLCEGHNHLEEAGVKDRGHGLSSPRGVAPHLGPLQESIAEIEVAADAAADVSAKLPEKEVSARLGDLISSLRAQGTGKIEVDPTRVHVLKSDRLRKLLVALRQILSGRESKPRPAALRVLRYLCNSPEAISIAREEYLDLFVARSLDRDSKEAALLEERAAA